MANHADTILHGGVVHSLLPGPARHAEAVALREGRVLAVGSDSDVLNLKGPGTRCEDLRGRCVLPGLTDSHCHLYTLGVTLMWLDLGGCRDFGEVVERVRRRAAELPGGQWILGASWDQNQWPEKEFPHHRLLSEAVPGHPVWLKRVCGHVRLANARAMELAGVTRETKAPEGGEILRDADGEPTGIFIDTAQELVERHVPPFSEEQNREAMRLGGAHCLERGLTCVHETGISQAQLAMYKAMVDEGDFPLRVYAMLAADTGYTLVPDGPEALSLDDFLERGPLVDYGGGMLTLRTLKVLGDGSLGARSAALLEDYSDAPGERGLLCLSREFHEDLLRRATRAGFQVATHAIGDRANRLVLDSVESVLRDMPELSALRPRIEHAQIVHPEDLPRFARLGVLPCMQGCHAVMDRGYAQERLGEGRMDRLYAWRALLDAGNPVPNGSDFPVADADPLYGMHCSARLCDRDGKPEGGWCAEKKMTLLEALRGYTGFAAQAAFQENASGVLAPGMRADLTVLSRDILADGPESLLDTRVEETWLAGRCAWRREES